MRLVELKGVPREIRGANSEQDIVDYFNRMGFTHVGGGYYSEVFTFENKNKVIKVFDNDAGYLRWVEFCRANQQNPYIPKVSKPAMINKWKRRLYMVVVERLTEPRDDRDESTIRVGLTQAAYNWEDANANAMKLPLSFSVLGMTEEEFFNTIRMVIATPHLRDIAEFLSKNQKDIDLNRYNVMRRGEQIVITDPLAA